MKRATLVLASNFVLLSNEDFSQNDAFSDVTIEETTLGDPARDGFHGSAVAMGGKGKSARSDIAAQLIAKSPAIQGDRAPRLP